MAKKREHTLVTNRIRELRFHANEMTQQHLADAVGVSRQTVVAIEKGKYSPTLELAFKIAAVFGTTVGSVFAYGDGSNQSNAESVRVAAQESGGAGT